jgi:putative transposase
MDTLKKGWHCAYQTHYHIVFPVKYRKALLSEPIVATLKQTTNNISERYELEIEQIGADQDHIY